MHFFLDFSKLAQSTDTVATWRALVVTSVLVAGLVAGLVADLVLLRHVFSESGVATACSCRDIFLVKRTSRQLIDVATFWSLQLLSRQPGVIANSSISNCCRDNLMLSRPLLLANDVAITRCCRDLIFYRIVVATTFSF